MKNVKKEMTIRMTAINHSTNAMIANSFFRSSEKGE